jgi:hypothetical protein
MESPDSIGPEHALVLAARQFAIETGPLLPRRRLSFRRRYRPASETNCSAKSQPSVRQTMPRSGRSESWRPRINWVRLMLNAWKRPLRGDWRAFRPRAQVSSQKRLNCRCATESTVTSSAAHWSLIKSVLALPTARRVRDRDHVKSVAKQSCLIPADAHHLRFAQSPALGRKVSDEFTVPLCRGHHREVHRCGDEVAWWENRGIDPIAAARVL